MCVCVLQCKVGAILKAMAEGFNRIRLWRHCAYREAEVNAPTSCW